MLSIAQSPIHSNRGPLAILSLVAFVAFSAPFLFGYGTAPLTNFAGEIVSASGFATLMLVAALYGDFSSAHKNIKHLTAAITILALATIAQYFYFGGINTPSWLMVIGYLAMGWTAAWTGSAARSGQHLTEWMQSISIGLVIGATIAALGSIAQFLNFDGGFIVLSPAQQAGRTFGFIRQPNHQGTFLNIGLASILYLTYIATTLRTKVLLTPITIIVVFAILTTGSRTALVQVIFLSACAALTFKSRGLRVALFLLTITTILWAVLYALNYFDVANFYGANKAVQTSSEGLGLRSKLWSETWGLIGAHPIIGSGLIYFGSDFIISGAAEQVGIPMTHSHNIILQTLYAFGFPTSLIVSALLFGLFLKIHKSIFITDVFLPTCMIGCIAIHSLVEFPLWYTYFLLPFCFCLGWTSNNNTNMTPIKKQIESKKKYLPFIAGIITIAVVFWINKDYYKITPVYTAGLKSTLSQRVQTAEQNFWFKTSSEFISLNQKTANSENYQEYLNRVVKNGCVMFELWYQPGTIVALTYAGKLDEAKWIIYNYWKLSGGYATHFRPLLEASDAPSKREILKFIDNPHPVEPSTNLYEAGCFKNRRI